MRILFISRAYPPVTGGIENQNYGLANALKSFADVKIIANKKGKRNLPFFLPWAGLAGLFFASRFDAIILGDGVLSPIGRMLKFFYPRKKVFSIIHGLDITYARKKSLLGRVYRSINIPALKSLDKLVMVGNSTIEETVKSGILRDKCVFIPNGVDPKDICEKHGRSELENLIGMSLDEKKAIVRVGRYVKHKGTDWFIEEVMPKLPENYILVAAGGVVAKKTPGDENIHPICQKAVVDNKLKSRVVLLTNLLWRDMKVLFNTADLFISPNVKIEGSMEGFGINAIEGAACGRVVVASRLEGLQDAITDGENGFLIEPGNVEEYVRTITRILEDDESRAEFSQRAKNYTTRNFSWDVIAKKYMEVLAGAR
ncbi:MAG: glycosyltransferase family 4 protein [Parcubacteria group bacterium]|jgi:phosphatidylinositol alpha-1,6-mannosyltransferase